MRTRTPLLVRLGVVFLLAVGLGACADSEASRQASAENQPTATLAAADLPSVTVYKSPTCGCCAQWVGHLEENGFTVKVMDMANVQPMKERLGVPAQLASCHTAYADGYAFEGHVPADVMKLFLAEQPQATGLAVPGMPIGSPGMEIEGRAAQPYQVLAFNAQGEVSVYAER